MIEEVVNLKMVAPSVTIFKLCCKVSEGLQDEATKKDDVFLYGYYKYAHKICACTCFIRILINYVYIRNELTPKS